MIETKFLNDWPVLARACFYRRAELAKLLQVSERTLDSYFKRQLFHPASRWLRELRLLDAYRKVVAEEILNRVALEVGFKTPTHFSKRFRIRFGVSPGILQGSVQARAHPAVRADLPSVASTNHQNFNSETSICA